MAPVTVFVKRSLISSAYLYW